MFMFFFSSRSRRTRWPRDWSSDVCSSDLFDDRIHFAHIRNVHVFDNGSFIETSHRTQDGTVDIYGIMKAYHDVGFTDYVRPDHGRHVWDESCRPGYGLYDRGMGIMYLWGIWDTLERVKEIGNL